jgi:hypothetical protein
MLTREIPRKEWVTFFNNFSRQYQGWSINLEIMEKDVGAQLEAHELPLEGIAADLKQNGKDTISIILGDAPNDHMTHKITAPTHVRVELTDKGYREALQIESEGGATTLLSFCSVYLE